MRYRPASLLLAIIAALSACSSHGDRGAAGATAVDRGSTGAGGSLAGASGSAPSAGAGGVGGSGPGSYRVTVHAVQTILCPGQCTAISAVAANGHAPYRYVWSDGLPEGEGPHEICPDETTTYEVTASDTAIEDEEFAHASESVSASLELQVVDDDACASDGGTPIGPEQRELCTIELPYADPMGDIGLSSLGSGRALATDPDGNLYFTGNYTASFDLGDHVLNDDRKHTSFIAKYAPSCELLWVKRYVTEGASLESIAAGPRGELVAAGGLYGAADLDALHVDRSAESFGGALLASFDPSDGTALWAQTWGSVSDGVHLANLTFAPDGDIVIDGSSGENVVVGDHAVNNPSDGALIAKLSSTGELRFAQVFVGADLYLNHADGRDGTIAVTALNREAAPTYGSVALDIPFLHRFVALLGADGELLWVRDLDRDLEVSTQPTVGLIQIDRDGGVLVTHGNLTTDRDGEIPALLSKYDASGTWIGTRTIAPMGSHPNLFRAAHMALDSLDNVIYLASVDSDDPMPADAGVRAEGRTPNDLVVRKLAPDGAELWRHQLDTDVFQRAWGLTVAADDSIWIGHGEDADIDPLRGTIRITKLAP